MLNVEVKLTDGTIHIVKDEESDNATFCELIRYDTTNLFFKDRTGCYFMAKNIAKFKFIEEQVNG
jgi:hypothetical protein